MARNYPNFLDAYFNYHKDQFIPSCFTHWTAISIVAGALERKVWIPWSEFLNYYPNLYILLVAHPSIGKSSAINPGVELLRDMNRTHPTMKFIPSQVTEARLIEIMRHPSIFEHEGLQVKQCAGYYYASEASACLRDIYGSFVNTITAFYDCDRIWEKGTMGMGDEIFTLHNICFNLIAGSTFNYLNELITKNNIMGGFASRINYVVQRDVVERNSPWQNRGIKRIGNVTYGNLLADLNDIHSMTGSFVADESYKKHWEAWFPAFDKKRQTMESEKHQALVARKHVNLLKLSMILSAAESSDLVLKESHWLKAMQLTDELEAGLPDMLREGQAKDTGSQSGLNAALFRHIMKCPDKTIKLHKLQQKLMFDGFKYQEVSATIKSFNLNNSVLQSIGSGTVKLIGNPNNYL